MLQLLGCNHRATETALREQLAVPAARLPEALRLFRDRFPKSEAVLLSTCNRTELYTAAAIEAHLPSGADLADFLAELNGLRGSHIFEQLIHTTGESAVRHLFTVAASLDSMVVGETQILGQVKQAYQVASSVANTGMLTHAAFQSAIRVAKRISRETSLHDRRVSVANVAVRELARQVFERFDDKQILVIGAGETAKDALRCLCEEGGRNFTVVNRNLERATELARQFGGTACGLDQMDDLLAASDLIVSATSADGLLIPVERYREIESRRFQRTQFILDLAVPRDFDPAIGELLGVYLYSIDDLKTICDRNLELREQELPIAQGIIDEETSRFMQDLMHRSTAPTIRQLRHQAHRVKHDELERLLNKLGELEDHHQAEIAGSFERLVNKLLHPPLESLKDEASLTGRARLLEAMRRLFQLGDQ